MRRSTAAIWWSAHSLSVSESPSAGVRKGFFMCGKSGRPACFSGLGGPGPFCPWRLRRRASTMAGDRRTRPQIRSAWVSAGFLPGFGCRSQGRSTCRCKIAARIFMKKSWRRAIKNAKALRSACNLSSISFCPLGLTSVSYTHLDVYKRQPLTISISSKSIDAS